MTYTGNVKVGGPSETREIDGLTVTKLAVGPMDNNAYLLRDTGTGEGLLIDAANEPGRIIEMVGDVPITWLVTTHRHFDHWQALKEVHDAVGGVVVAQTADAPELPIPVDDDLSDGDILRFGDAAVSVIHLRGHTPGSVAILYDADGRLAAEPHLFTGDSLFPGGPGKTNSPEDFGSLMNDLEERVFGRLPDGTWVYPSRGRATHPGAAARRPGWCRLRGRGRPRCRRVAARTPAPRGRSSAS